MRGHVILFGVLGLSGCASHYVLKEEIPTGCPENTYFLDADQDGWGSSTESEVACEPKVDGERLFTARNNMDCNDSDLRVTGRVGAVCADQTVTGNPPYRAQVYNSREYVAIMGDKQVSAATAGASCGEYGWGGSWGLANPDPGGLATFNSLQGLFRLANEIDDQLNTDDIKAYAAWVGVVPNESNDGWVYERFTADEQAEFGPGNLGYCAGTMPMPDPTQPDRLRLALVKKASTGDWCFGFPSEASDDDLGLYTDLKAHFICERPRPDFRCWVYQNEEPWTVPCSCREQRGETDLVPVEDPEAVLRSNNGREAYQDMFDGKLCLEG